MKQKKNTKIPPCSLFDDASDAEAADVGKKVEQRTGKPKPAATAHRKKANPNPVPPTGSTESADVPAFRFVAPDVLGRTTVARGTGKAATAAKIGSAMDPGSNVFDIADARSNWEQEPTASAFFLSFRVKPELVDEVSKRLQERKPVAIALSDCDMSSAKEPWETAVAFAMHQNKHNNDNNDTNSVVPTFSFLDGRNTTSGMTTALPFVVDPCTNGEEGVSGMFFNLVPPKSAIIPGSVLASEASSRSPMHWSGSFLPLDGIIEANKEMIAAQTKTDAKKWTMVPSMFSTFPEPRVSTLDKTWPGFGGEKSFCNNNNKTRVRGAIGIVASTPIVRFVSLEPPICSKDCKDSDRMGAVMGVLDNTRDVVSVIFANKGNDVFAAEKVTRAEKVTPTTRNPKPKARKTRDHVEDDEADTKRSRIAPPIIASTEHVAPDVALGHEIDKIDNFGMEMEIARSPKEPNAAETRVLELEKELERLGKRIASLEKMRDNAPRVLQMNKNEIVEFLNDKIPDFLEGHRKHDIDVCRRHVDSMVADGDLERQPLYFATPFAYATRNPDNASMVDWTLMFKVDNGSDSPAFVVNKNPLCSFVDDEPEK